MRTPWIKLAVIIALVAPTGALAQSGAKAYRALGLETKDVLTGTVLNSRVTPGDNKQIVCVATYFTGKQQKAEAVNVRLGVFDAFGDGLVAVYTRDFGLERDGNIANGDLLVMDIDRDGINEIIVSYDDFEDPLIEQRFAEVILHDGTRLDTAWTGLVEYDATKAARSIPQERRDRFVREFDWGNTLRTNGVTLFVKKRMIAVAGERLPEPQIVDETFTLRGRPEHW